MTIRSMVGFCLYATVSAPWHLMKAMVAGALLAGVGVVASIGESRELLAFQYREAAAGNPIDWRLGDLGGD